MTIPSQDMMKACKKCGIVKMLYDFMPQQNRCRECYNKYHRDWRAKIKQEYAEKSKARYHQNIASMDEKELKEFRKKSCEKTKKRNDAIREKVFMAYGGYKCVCCGETEPSFLTIDHINNDGARARKKIGYPKGGTHFYTWIIKNGFPDDLQVLCWNCQWGKVKNNGICPHRIRCNDYPIKGVGLSSPKLNTPVSGDDIVYSVWKHTAAERRTEINDLR